MGSLVQRIYSFLSGRRFDSSSEYWQDRYLAGGSSGAGSRGRLAKFKATVLNDLVKSKGVTRVIELGCGDGSQLALAEYPEYLGVDVARAAVMNCRAQFAGDESKTFITLEEFRRGEIKGDLLLSLDVIYHLVEDDVFDAHMRDLFGRAGQYVAIYSSNSDQIADPAPHVRHRDFTTWIGREATGWRLAVRHANPYPFNWRDRENTSHCDLFVFERVV